MLRYSNISLLLCLSLSGSLGTKPSLQDLPHFLPHPRAPRELEGPLFSMGSELLVSTTEAVAGVYGVRLRRLNSAPLFIHKAAKPLGQKALERETRLGAQNKQNPAGSPSISHFPPFNHPPREGPTHPGRSPPIQGGAHPPREELTPPGRNPPTHPLIRPALTAGALSAQKGTPTPGALLAES